MNEWAHGPDSQEMWILPSVCQAKEFAVRGNLVTVRDRAGGRAETAGACATGAERFAREEFLASEVLTLDEVAASDLPGLDRQAVLREMSALGPDARLLVCRRGAEILGHEVFRDPRICRDLNVGAVIENLREAPVDRSGWRVHEFYIDPKGCLGDECGRCAVVCPESAIHLRGSGKGSFHEIDPAACKGCFICWVECVRTAADCIVIDGKSFDGELRARHFGE